MRFVCGSAARWAHQQSIRFREAQWARVVHAEGAVRWYNRHPASAPHRAWSISMELQLASSVGGPGGDHMACWFWSALIKKEYSHQERQRLRLPTRARVDTQRRALSSRAGLRSGRASSIVSRNVFESWKANTISWSAATGTGRCRCRGRMRAYRSGRCGRSRTFGEQLGVAQARGGVERQFVVAELDHALHLQR